MRFLIDYLAVIITTTLIRDYLLNYARSLIYTTSLSYANIIAADCSFDMLTDGTAQRVRFLPSSSQHTPTHVPLVVQAASLPLILFHRDAALPSGIAENPSHTCLPPIAPPSTVYLGPPIPYYPRPNTPPTPTLRLPPRTGHECTAYNMAYSPEKQGPCPGVFTCWEHKGRH